MTHVLGLQQQSSIGQDFNPQFLEKQQPPEQAYRNPELDAPQSIVPTKREEESVQVGSGFHCEKFYVVSILFLAGSRSNNS